MDLNSKAWFYVARHDVCVGVPAKCGGTAFYRSMFDVPDSVATENVRGFAVKVALETGAGPFSPYEATHFFSEKQKLLAVREPVERFASLWRDKHRNTAPLDLLGVIARFPMGDPHWMPQYLQVVPRVELVSHERLGEVLGYGCRENESEKRRDDPEMPADDIRRYYAQDVVLWTSSS